MFGLIHFSNVTQADQLSIFKMVPGTSKAEWIAKVVQRLKSSKATGDVVSLVDHLKKRSDLKLIHNLAQ